MLLTSPYEVKQIAAERVQDARRAAEQFRLRQRVLGVERFEKGLRIPIWGLILDISVERTNVGARRSLRAAR